MFIRTIGLKRAEAKIVLANLAYNMHRLIFHERRAAMGKLCLKTGKTAENGEMEAHKPGNYAKIDAPGPNPLRSPG